MNDQFSIFAKPKKLTQADRILRAIQAQPGITNYELIPIALNYTMRVSELRKQGYNIVAKREWRQGKATGTFRYWVEKNEN